MGIPTDKQRIGALGEDISVKYLKNKGFSVIGRNYLKKCGEIDIICEKQGILHFAEVKSVSCEIGRSFKPDVSRETDVYRPEDNVHPSKLKRLARTIELYLLEKFPKNDQVWQFDVITVKLDLKTKQAQVNFLQDIVI
jgi:putative endonuclease